MRIKGGNGIALGNNDMGARGSHASIGPQAKIIDYFIQDEPSRPSACENPVRALIQVTDFVCRRKSPPVGGDFQRLTKSVTCSPQTSLKI